MQRILLNILLLVSISWLAACQQAAVMPDEVAHSYWSAIKSGDSSTLKSLTIDSNDVTKDMLISSLQLTDFKIKRTIIEAENAIVEVELQLANTGSVPVLVNTVLVKHNQSWLVDHKTTVATLSSQSDIGDAIAALHKFSRLFSKDLDDSLSELERQAPVIRNDIVNIIQKITERVPVLKKELEKLAEEIDKTVKPLMEKDDRFSKNTAPAVKGRRNQIQKISDSTAH
jgi:arsenate reductase-like glutaredoxin family protein